MKKGHGVEERPVFAMVCATYAGVFLSIGSFLETGLTRELGMRVDFCLRCLLLFLFLKFKFESGGNSLKSYLSSDQDSNYEETKVHI